MDYFVNNISKLEQDVRKNYGYDYDIEEVIYADLNDYFTDLEAELFYEVFSGDQFETVETLRSSSSDTIVLTETMCILTVDEVRFLLFDLVEIVIVIIDKRFKEELNTIINSLV